MREHSSTCLSLTIARRAQEQTLQMSPRKSNWGNCKIQTGKQSSFNMLSKVLFTSNPQCDFIGDLNMKIVTIKFSRGRMPMFVFLVISRVTCN